MNEKAIQQLANVLDAAFGRPGSAQIAMQNLELIRVLDEAVKAYEGAMKEAEAQARASQEKKEPADG
jgi:hypothetical protein